MRFGVGIYPIGPAPESIHLARLAEDVGFDCLWLADTHMIWREMYVLLGAMAASTRRIAIGPGVTHPFVRHQSVIASAAATLAELAPGRVHLGLGIGASGPANIGLKQASLRELEDALRFIRTLLKAESVERDGKTMQLRFASGAPIPIYVAGASDRTHEMTARVADGALIQGPNDHFAGSVDLIRKAEAGAGRSRGSVATVMWMAACLDDDAETARTAVRPMVARNAMVWLGRAGRLGTLDPVDAAPLARLQREYNFYQHMEAKFSALVEERWIDRFAMAGPPAVLRQRCREAFAGGADQVAVAFQGQNRDRQIERFGRDVIEPMRRSANTARAT